MELQAACYIMLGSNQGQTPKGDMTDKTGQYKFADFRNVRQAQRKQTFFIHLCPKNSAFFFQKSASFGG